MALLAWLPPPPPPPPPAPPAAEDRDLRLVVPCVGDTLSNELLRRPRGVLLFDPPPALSEDTAAAAAARLPGINPLPLPLPLPLSNEPRQVICKSERTQAAGNRRGEGCTGKCFLVLENSCYRGDRRGTNERRCYSSLSLGPACSAAAARFAGRKRENKTGACLRSASRDD